MSFRRDLMIECRNRGHQVFAVGPGDESVWKKKFHNLGIEYHRIPLRRTSINPFHDLVTLFRLVKLLKIVKPDKIYICHAKMLVYGSLACRIAKVKGLFLLVPGLGSILRGVSFRSKLIKPLLKMQYKFAFRQSKKVFVQNPDDAQELVDNKLLSEDKFVIVNGSGVDINHYLMKPMPSKPAFIFIGRMLRDKGIFEYLEACTTFKRYHPDIRCLIVGSYDSNPSSINACELNPYLEENIVEYHGSQEDVRPYISQCSTLILPSYHEGTPRSVLEAMSMGRSIITTDAPGCRETVVDGYNGYLVQVGDFQTIAQRMLDIVEHYSEQIRMGENSRFMAVEKYDVRKVNRFILDVMDIGE